MSGTTTKNEGEPEDEIPDELIEAMGLESARRQWLKEATLSGELDSPHLADLAPEPDPEPDKGPEIEP